MLNLDFRVALWDEKLKQMLAQLETASNTKIGESVRKAERVRQDFEKKIEV